MSKSTKKTATKASKTTKSTATKATKTVKPTATKTVAKKTTPTKSTGNKVLDGILQNISDAKKAGAKSVVVFTTNSSHYKANLSVIGFGSTDLKPKVLEAYKHIFCKFDVSTKLVNPNELAVEWIVKLK